MACQICSKDLLIKRLSFDCGHSFHPACVSKQKCPLCVPKFCTGCETRLVNPFVRYKGCEHAFHEACASEEKCPKCSNTSVNTESTCSVCRVFLGTDYLSFGCQHRYHKRCLGDNEKDCPICKYTKGKLPEKPKDLL
jgi:hypothetical protein